jgi:amino acid transporter
MVAVLFFALALNPGGNIYLGIALVLPMTLGFAYAFGLLTQMIPRDGGDYMLVSRVVHPAWGLVSSFCMTMAGLLSNAFFGLAITIVGLGPGLIGIGLVGDHPKLVEWGNTILTSKGWQLGIGVVMFAFAGAIQLFGWRTLLRIQLLFFSTVTLSLLIGFFVALFTSHNGFIEDFNAFARPYTGDLDSYAQVIANGEEAGIPTAPGFSFANTIPLIGILATTAIFSYWSTFVGGELRQASTMKTARNMALGGVIPLAIVLICAVVFFKTFGGDFLRAANGGGMPPEIAVSNTPYFYLVPIIGGGAPLGWVLLILYIVFWPLITYISSLQQTRMLFQYSFDGILPRGITRVNRYGCPWVALLVALVASAITLVWAVGYFGGGGFFKALAYALLVQLIAMMSVGLAAVLAPIRRPHLYRASASQKRVLGVPLMQIAGLVAIASGGTVWGIYLAYDRLGINGDLGEFFAWMFGTAAAGLAFWLLVYLYKRSKGIDITRVYREIPPE